MADATPARLWRSLGFAALVLGTAALGRARRRHCHRCHRQIDFAAARRALAAQGWFVIRGLLPAPQVARLRRAYSRLESKAAAALAHATAPGQPPLVVGDNAPRDGSKRIHIDREGVRYDFNIPPGVPTEQALADPRLSTDGGPLELLMAAHCGAADEDIEALCGGRDSGGLLALASALLGTPSPSGAPCALTQIIQQAHFKPPGSSCRFPWHQDSLFRRIHAGDFVDLNGLGSYVNVSVAIDAEVEENGPIAVIPGTHTEGHRGGAAGIDHRRVDATRAVRPLLQPGDALVIGPYIVHGSAPNRSASRRRRSLIFGAAIPAAIRSRQGAVSMSWFRERHAPAEGTPCCGRIELWPTENKIE